MRRRSEIKVHRRTLGHRRVLFLDEAPEFFLTFLDALREPPESGVIALARSGTPAGTRCEAARADGTSLPVPNHPDISADVVRKIDELPARLPVVAGGRAVPGGRHSATGQPPAGHGPPLRAGGDGGHVGTRAG